MAHRCKVLVEYVSYFDRRLRNSFVARTRLVRSLVTVNETIMPCQVFLMLYKLVSKYWL